MTTGYCYFCDAPTDGATCRTCGREASAVADTRRSSAWKQWLAGEGPSRPPMARRQAVMVAVVLGLVVYFLVFRVRWGIS